MAIPIQSIEESLSIAYVSAVAAKAGVTMDVVRRDFVAPQGMISKIRVILLIRGQRLTSCGFA